MVSGGLQDVSPLIIDNCRTRKYYLESLPANEESAFNKLDSSFNGQDSIAFKDKEGQPSALFADKETSLLSDDETIFIKMNGCKLECSVFPFFGGSCWSEPYVYSLYRLQKETSFLLDEIKYTFEKQVCKNDECSWEPQNISSKMYYDLGWQDTDRSWIDFETVFGTNLEYECVEFYEL